MGQLQSLLKLNSSGFEKMKENQTPPCSRKILSDPRSPTSEVCRTPIETACSQQTSNNTTPKIGKSFMSLRKWMAERDHEKQAVISSPHN